MTAAASAAQALVDACRQLGPLGINQGTSGNISLRDGERMLISPSATPYDTMQAGDVAAMPLHEGYGSWTGPLKPSTEWRFHLDIMRSRPDVGAIVHAHPTFCTALAIARQAIPPVHYMVAAFGGRDVRCAGYALFGTAALSAHVLAALEGRHGCLMANHGALVCGPTLEKALWLAVELEALARQYWHAMQVPGGPALLTDAEIGDALGAFADYGLQAK